MVHLRIFDRINDFVTGKPTLIVKPMTNLHTIVLDKFPPASKQKIDIFLIINVGICERLGY